MKILYVCRLCALIVLLLGAVQASASDREKSYLARLSEIHTISERGDEKLFLLIREASVELEQNWSPELARELARVFNALLDVNNNYFLTELLMPMSNIRANEFGPILDEALSSKNRKLYEELVEMVEREAREGNG
ncbi:hypothetical protein [Celeribacter halophilus]|jgi:hypothetical protein|uniref:hypothetical protein n=1 Tax=Celeribacter halophilus TaxID=576117 RepID=UPI002FD2A798